MQRGYRDIVGKVVVDRGTRMAGYMAMEISVVVLSLNKLLGSWTLAHKLVIFRDEKHVKIFLDEIDSQEHNSFVQNCAQAL
jgi:hypothetical protein